MDGWKEGEIVFEGKNDVSIDLMMRSLETENERNGSHERTKSTIRALWNLLSKQRQLRSSASR